VEDIVADSYVRRDGCLEDETLAALIDGGLDESTRREVLWHLDTCQACYDLFIESTETESDGSEIVPLRTVPAATTAPVSTDILTASGRSTFVRSIVAAAALVAIAASTWLFWPAQAGSRPELRGLVAAVGEIRATEGRLTGGFAWAPLDVATRGGNLVATLPRVQIAAAELDEAQRNGRSARTLAAYGTSRLVLRDWDAGVAALEEATGLAPDRADFWSDLASAYLARAAMPGRATDVPRALEAAETALALDSSLLEALFNRAVALERLSLKDQARDAWNLYLERDHSSAWRAEAEERLAAMSAPAATTPEAELESMRQRFFDRLLPEWGRAAIDTDGAEALTALRDAAARIDAGSTDTFAGDTVRAIERTLTSRASRTRLARAHAMLGEGQQHHRNRQYDEALASFRGARSAFDGADTPMALVAAFNEGTVHQLRSDLRGAVSVLEPVRAELVRRSYPWMLSRVSSALATIAALEARHSEARAYYDEALRASEGARDLTHRSAVLRYYAATHDATGDAWSGWPLRVEGLSHDRSPGSLLSAGLSASNLGWLHAASVLNNAALAAARHAGVETNVADALRVEALTQARLGNHTGARALLAEARTLVASHPEPSWARLRAEVALAEAQTAAAPDAAAALVSATDALSYFANTAISIRLPEAYLVRAQLHRHLQDVASATADIHAGLAVVRATRHTLRPGLQQAQFDEVGRRLANELVSLAASDDEADRAFAAVEESRGRDLRDVAADAVGIDRLREVMPRNVGLAEYVVTDESTYLWVVSPRGRRFHRIDAGRDLLAKLVRDVTPPRAEPEAAARLANLLLSDVTAALAADDTLVIVPDGPLHALPFTLLPAGAGERLIDRHAIVMSPSASHWLDATERLAPLQDRPRSVVALGNPSLDRAEYPRLETLPLAELESHAVAGHYPQPAGTFVGDAATREALLDGIRTADVTHFAGHAVVNASLDDASYLALAGRAPSRLTAQELRQLQGVRSRLVVLAACESADGSGRLQSGPMSLSRALLAAGVPTVVANVWPVSDRASRLLFDAFHEMYARTGDAPVALRHAQRLLASSPDATLSAPRQWAGFVVMGGVSPSSRGHQ
jgi:CHAT domain-containing protein/tetratricopeptide (TPR) repeat protein